MGDTGARKQQIGANGKPAGDIDFATMMRNTADDAISFDKGVTVLPAKYVPESGRKKDLEALINRYNINEVRIDVYNNQAGRRDLQRMKDLGFEVQAQTLAKSQNGEELPPWAKHYYYMVRKQK